MLISLSPRTALRLGCWPSAGRRGVECADLRHEHDRRETRSESVLLHTHTHTHTHTYTHRVMIHPHRHFGPVRLTRNSPQICGWCGTNRTEPTTPTRNFHLSGNSLLMVQSVSGGCKLDPKFAMQSNTSHVEQVTSGHTHLPPPRTATPQSTRTLLPACSP